ncbi:Homeobox protein ceh-36 [Thelohanellus kitauei]|uniref:Homeobox protein ceh-36 n=1 Tax=Thelohanellus kitauei TaxID=669202 RepID=A0A0C2MM93_THEKT|nr:Homeobox protein ceh-36 [Thelohanellus kitauei]
MTDLQTSQSSDEPGKSKRRSRTCFSRSQLDELEAVFVRNRYPDPNIRKQLVENLHISDGIIQIWFKNRRAKEKKNTSSKDNKSQRSFTTYPRLVSVQRPPTMGIQSMRTNSCQAMNMRPYPMYPPNMPNPGPHYNHPGLYSHYSEQPEYYYPTDVNQQYYVYSPQMDQMSNYQNYYGQSIQSCPSIDSQSVGQSYYDIEDKENVQ